MFEFNSSYLHLLLFAFFKAVQTQWIATTVIRFVNIPKHFKLESHTVVKPCVNE